MPTKRVVSIVAPPEVFEQPVLVIHKAYEYRWDGVLGPKHRNREPMSAFRSKAENIAHVEFFRFW
jgi:hypothetical protein